MNTLVVFILGFIVGWIAHDIYIDPEKREAFKKLFKK